MELLWVRNGTVRRVGWRVLAGSIMVLVCLTAGSLQRVPGTMHGGLESANAVSAESVSVEREQVAQALRVTDTQMSVLAARLGALQGRLTRLESIGQQVGMLAGLDPTKLGFDQPVAVGGPVTDDQVMQLPELLNELRAFAAGLDDRTVRFELLDRELLVRDTNHQRLPSGKPTSSGWLSSAYGYRTHPLSGRRQFHRGVDLAGAAGDPVEAVASGLVTWAGPRDGYGNLVELDHRNGYQTRYAHNNKTLVAIGELVRQGQQIATMGSTGNSTGPHVHFEVIRNGKHINPQKFLKGRRLAGLND